MFKVPFRNTFLLWTCFAWLSLFYRWFVEWQHPSRHRQYHHQAHTHFLRHHACTPCPISLWAFGDHEEKMLCFACVCASHPHPACLPRPLAAYRQASFHTRSHNSTWQCCWLLALQGQQHKHREAHIHIGYKSRVCVSVYLCSVHDLAASVSVGPHSSYSYTHNQCK